MRQIVRLTESDLHNMIYAATKQYIKELQEMTTSQAAVAAGANTSAFRDYTTTGSVPSETKMNRADLVRLPVLTKAVIDKFGNFKIKLVEQNLDNGMTYVNYFVFDCVVLIDDNSCVMKGEISIGGRPYSIGYVRYLFNEDSWQRVSWGAKLKVTLIRQLEPFTANKPLVDDIVEFLKDYLAKVATNKESALSGPFVPSKPRKPLTPQARNRLYGDYLSAYGKKKAVTPIEKL